MISVLLLNVGAAIVLVGLWTGAVVHVYRSLAADERRPTATPRAAWPRAPKSTAATTSHGQLAYGTRHVPEV